MSGAQPRKAVLAIDHGEKHTGFAYVDALRLVPLPLGAYHGPGHGDGILEYIARELDQRTVGLFLVGLPGSSGAGDKAGAGKRSKGSRQGQVLSFAKALQQRFPELALVLYDEHLTTKAAEDLAREAELSLRQMRARSDSLSALVLLRDWLSAGEPDPGPGQTPD